jgi:hypothetical protein
MTAPRPAHALLLAAVVWLAWGAARELEQASAALSAPPRAGDVAFWRLGSDASEPLRYFLADVDRAVPPGEVAVFSGPTGDPAQEHFLRLWAAYLLPRHRVIGPAHPAAATAGFVITYGLPPDPARRAAGLETVIAHPYGTLYRAPR